MKRFFCEICLSCLLLLIVYFGFYLPPLREYHSQDDEVQRSHSRVETNLPRIMARKSAAAKLEEATRILSDFQKKIDTSIVKGDVAMDLRRNAKNLDICITKELPWVTHKRELEEIGSNTVQSHYNELEKQMSLRGSYLAVAQFMEGIENLDIFARNSSINMFRKDNNDSELDVELKIILYDLQELIFD